jgi:hypothetical protein
MKFSKRILATAIVLGLTTLPSAFASSTPNIGEYRTVTYGPKGAVAVSIRHIDMDAYIASKGKTTTSVIANDDDDPIRCDGVGGSQSSGHGGMSSSSATATQHSSQILHTVTVMCGGGDGDDDGGGDSGGGSGDEPPGDTGNQNPTPPAPESAPSPPPAPPDNTPSNVGTVQTIQYYGNGYEQITTYNRAVYRNGTVGPWGAPVVVQKKI